MNRWDITGRVMSVENKVSTKGEYSVVRLSNHGVTLPYVLFADAHPRIPEVGDYIGLAGDIGAYKLRPSFNVVMWRKLDAQQIIRHVEMHGEEEWKQVPSASKEFSSEEVPW